MARSAQPCCNRLHSVLSVGADSPPAPYFKNHRDGLDSPPSSSTEAHIPATCGFLAVAANPSMILAAHKHLPNAGAATPPPRWLVLLVTSSDQVSYVSAQDLLILVDLVRLI